MPVRVQIVGIYLVKNEEFYIDRVIKNTHEFCDKIIIVDNHSIDNTINIARNWQKKSDKVDVHIIDEPAASHQYVRQYCGSKTWVFAVDGDEIYDPAGLAKLKRKLCLGVFDEYWSISGNVLNCVFMDEEKRQVKGYLAPPCRSMTKLYNFNAITDWTGCTSERMHGGNISFKDGWNKTCKNQLHKSINWDDAIFRCLHLCFMQRSSVDQVDQNGMSIRRNLMELHGWAGSKWLNGLKSFISGGVKVSDYKQEKYMRGDLVEKDCSQFL